MGTNTRHYTIDISGDIPRTGSYSHSTSDQGDEADQANHLDRRTRCATIGVDSFKRQYVYLAGDAVKNGKIIF